MWTSHIILLFFAFFIPFLIGTIPVGYLLGKIKKVDIRNHGSGGTGGTNVGRILGSFYGYLTYIIDGLKAYLAVTLVLNIFFLTATKEYSYDMSLELLQFIFGISVVLGNIFNPFLSFRSGKGIATSAGVILGISWEVASIALLAFFIFGFATEIISVASIFSVIIAGITSTILYNFFHAVSIFTVYLCLSLLPVILFSHRENIRRLIKRQEPKFSFKKKNPSD